MLFVYIICYVFVNAFIIAPFIERFEGKDMDSDMYLPTIALGPVIFIIFLGVKLADKIRGRVR